MDKIDIYVTGDTAWHVLVLGMDNMSPHWYVHCLLRQKDWKHHDHQLGEPRTIEFNCVMANSNVPKGHARKGVKSKPY